MTEPNPPMGRLTELDATRGLAVMGILLINIISFSMPFAAYVNPLAWGGTSAADMTVWTINQLLFEGRMRGLFALLFGVSALLVIERGDAGGRSGNAIHLRRMAVLAILGVAHLILIWDGDILLHYAVVGLLIPVLRWLPVRHLIGLAIAILLIFTLIWSGMMGGALYLEHAARVPGASPDIVRQAREMLAGFPTVGADGAEVARMRGGYADIMTHRLVDAPMLFFQAFNALAGETLAYMLVGMALWRTGFFTGGWDDHRLKRLMAWCYAISLPGIAALTWWAFASGFDPVVLMGNWIAWGVPLRMLCAVGHLALAMLVLRRLAGSPLMARLAATGRMALSNYLATSIVMTTIFYGYGFALFGHVDRAPVYAFVFAMWALMLLWSKPWLDRFAYGPFEWLWRSLARLELQPMRRTEHR